MRILSEKTNSYLMLCRRGTVSRNIVAKCRVTTLQICCNVFEIYSVELKEDTSLQFYHAHQNCVTLSTCYIFFYT